MIVSSDIPSWCETTASQVETYLRETRHWFPDIHGGGFGDLPPPGPAACLPSDPRLPRFGHVGYRTWTMRPRPGTIAEVDQRVPLGGYAVGVCWGSPPPRQIAR